VITLTGVRKRFGPLQVLADVDLAVPSGRVTAVVGPNSAGKTTLIKSILGLTRIDAGSISVDGRPLDPGGAYRECVGYMPQIARFPENLSASDLFAMMRDLRSGARAEDPALVEALSLTPFLDRPLRVLSGGTRQKVNAALAFLFTPSVLILDEPTAGLDPVSSGAVKDKMMEARDNGATVLLTSHVMSELDELADDVAFLVDGRIRYAGSVHDLKKRTRQLSLERAVAQVLAEGLAA
jgi:Cu-processing system ATP-binding protein